MAPPELTADTPVLNVFEPDAVCGLVFFGNEADDVVHDGLERDVSEVFHRNEPLGRQTRLDGDLGALREADLVVIVLDFLEHAGGSEVFGDALAHLETVEAGIGRAAFVDGAVFVEDVDGLEVVLLAEHIVVLVVGGSHFETAGAEVNLDIAVLDDGNLAADEGHDDALAFEPLVLGVFGVDAHRRVAHDGLGACRGDDCIAASLGVAVDDFLLGAGLTGEIVVGEVVAQIVELRFLIDEEDLVVADGRAVGGVPVDHAQAAVDISFVVEVAEDLDDALRTAFVHGEGRAVPVARCAELAQLLKDDAAMGLGPVPCMDEELLACEIGFPDALRGEFGDDLGLRSDRGMVGAGHPEGVLALHARAAHEDVLNRIVEHVTHVEHTGHVWRGNDDCIRLTIIGF